MLSIEQLEDLKRCSGGCSSCLASDFCQDRPEEQLVVELAEELIRLKKIVKEE